ncbi:hypothetical protein CCR80_11440 [Rhodothalassium salexigens]|uniref:DUF2842 domain-containing protein n=1 Tax=Rhodothalassium salexigens TaxID=1086 RepID=UPI001911E32D|nr:hypothetical protein [Rhodothalassium salexigens]
MTPERPNNRNLVGMLALVLGLTIYAGIVAWLAEWIGAMPLLIEVLFYLILGTAWLWPAGRLLRWMAAGRRGDGD